MKDSKAKTYFTSGHGGDSLGEQQGKLGTLNYMIYHWQPIHL